MPLTIEHQHEAKDDRTEGEIKKSTIIMRDFNSLQTVIVR